MLLFMFKVSLYCFLVQ
uniref:Uncharacterized protein n=1 Tax=Anguilla anguilla TaxID=7936 RepID=A0A0E9QQ65_ANGAN